MLIFGVKDVFWLSRVGVVDFSTTVGHIGCRVVTVS